MRASLAGRLFEEFVVDVGLDDPAIAPPEEVSGVHLLEFAEIPRVSVPTLPLPQHLAEKAHAYTRQYGQTGFPSTRVKVSSTSHSLLRRVP